MWLSYKDANSISKISQTNSTVYSWKSKLILPKLEMIIFFLGLLIWSTVTLLSSTKAKMLPSEWSVGQWRLKAIKAVY